MKINGEVSPGIVEIFDSTVALCSRRSSCPVGGCQRMGGAKGTIAVFDKGFQKFAQYADWTANGVFYLIRMNRNATFKIIEQIPLEESCERGVQQDVLVELEYKDGKQGTRTTIARIVAYIDPSYVNLINFLTMTNTEIGSILANLKIVQIELFDFQAAFKNSS